MVASRGGGAARPGDVVAVVTEVVGDGWVVGELEAVGLALDVGREEAGVVLLSPPPLEPATVTDSFPFGAEATQGVGFVLQFGALAGVGRRAWIV
jgi:hypothetical protein